EGVSVLEKENNKWGVKGSAFGLEESCRIGAYEGEDVWWISHPYRGAWRIKLNRERWALDDVEFVGESKGFPSTLHICASQLEDQVVFTAEKGLFVYDKQKARIRSMDSWLPNYDLNRRFLRVFEERGGDVWCILDDAVEVLRVEETPLTKEWSVQKIDGLQSQFLAGFESLVDDGSGHLVAGSDDGFIKINKRRLKEMDGHHPNLMVLEVELMNHNDSVLFHPFAGISQLQSVSVPLGNNSLRINYSTSSYALKAGLRYQTKLEGFDDEWIDNEQEQFKEFTNLESGEYVFKLRVLNSQDEVRAYTDLLIVVDSPWYLTTWALIGWFFLGGVALLLLVLLPQNRFERQKEELRKEKENEISIQREEATVLIDKMKHEQLNSELQFKNKELASVTMHLVQKGQILQDISTSLKKVDVKNQSSSEKEIARIIKIIKDDVRLDNNWERFERHFDQVHVDFLKRLKTAHQNLSPNDHKLCAYLKMNLSTKEIATIMNISVRGVEISRYRLRKKLGMEKDENLPEYIQSI
ncbi:MAG: triple tyrosine motif-containing protein, partial [Flavobacteriales bacterium]